MSTLAGSGLQRAVITNLLDQVDSLRAENAQLKVAAAESEAPALSPAMLGYWPAFEPARQDDLFLTYHGINPDKSMYVREHTRGDVLRMAQRAALALRRAGLRRGDTVLHLFSANRAEDVVLRLSSAMLGTVPVTVNWQADNAERVAFKARAADVKAIVCDEGAGVAIPGALEGLRAAVPAAPVLSAEQVTGAASSGGGADGDGDGDASSGESSDLLRPSQWEPSVQLDDARMIIFTSGTTGTPKGVRTSYRCYESNRAAFESLLGMEANVPPPGRGRGAGDAFVLVNPAHHTNTSAVGDWAVRRPGATVHLVERYSTLHWGTLADVAHEVGFDTDPGGAPAAAEPRRADARLRYRRRVIAPMVARHFDFLHALAEGGKLPVALDRLQAALHRVDILIGSSPVGPTTVGHVTKYADTLPHVRFGSTETTLQVLGTPLDTHDKEARLAAFEAGWAHKLAASGDPCRGFFIGRPHAPHTEAKLVRGLERGKAGYMAECEEGESGYLVCRGANVMQCYVGDSDGSLTRKVLHADSSGESPAASMPWYTGFGDLCFWLRDATDGGRNYYWQSRDSHMLIRGGANYAYEQINGELAAWLAAEYGLGDAAAAEELAAAGGDATAFAFAVAVVGLKLRSEHEDDCCATIELVGGVAQSRRAKIEETVLAAAKARCPKGAKPDKVRFGAIPRNFKGTVLYGDLKKHCKAEFGNGFEA